VPRAGQKNPRTENRPEVTENRYRRNWNRRSSVPVRFHALRNRSFSGYSVLGLGSPEVPKNRSLLLPVGLMVLVLTAES
jgi:hypothetical protein